jgi:hypothetical protein
MHMHTGGQADANARRREVLFLAFAPALRGDHGWLLTIGKDAQCLLWGYHTETHVFDFEVRAHALSHTSARRHTDTQTHTHTHTHTHTCIHTCFYTHIVTWPVADTALARLCG